MPPVGARSDEFEKMRYAFPNGAGHVSGCCTSELIKRKLAGCVENFPCNVQ